uniref:Uncharacterized protein n=1 Tax=Ditylenchus dipsaci TaxID=166011 RepID=A0A915D228_9BILA
MKPAAAPVKTVEFKPSLRINLEPYDKTKIDLGNAEMTRLWRGAPDMAEFVQDMLDEKIRWVASNFLLFNSDQYLIRASSWTYSIPELKATAEEITAAMLDKEV